MSGLTHLCVLARQPLEEPAFRGPLLKLPAREARGNKCTAIIIDPLSFASSEIGSQKSSNLKSTSSNFCEPLLAAAAALAPPASNSARRLMLAETRLEPRPFARVAAGRSSSVAVLLRLRFTCVLG